MRILAALALIVLTACSACPSCTTTGGVMPLTTFNEKIGTGYVSVQTIADAATLLHKAGKLNDSDATNVLAQDTNVKTALDIARSLHNTDPTAGDTKLTTTLTVLQALQTYLDSLKPKQ